jgi:hypothetical protein
LTEEGGHVGLWELGLGVVRLGGLLGWFDDWHVGCWDESGYWGAFSATSQAESGVFGMNEREGGVGVLISRSSFLEVESTWNGLGMT